MFYKDKIIGPKNIYIPNTIDISNDEKSKLNNKHIVSVGRISPEKGYFDLIDVMELVYKLDSSVTLTICGDGYQMEDLKKYINSNNLETQIEADGGINLATMENVKKAGADILVSGTAILVAKDYKVIIDELKKN